MKHGTYVGDRGELKGKTALLKIFEDETVWAQFDDRSLDALGLTSGWTTFLAADFELDEENDWAFGQRGVKTDNDWEV